MHGSGRDSMVEYVNARLVPKEGMEDMRREVSTVLTGYLAYLQRLNHRFSGAPAPYDISEPLPLDVLMDDLDREIAKLPHGLRTVKPELTFHFIKYRYNPEESRGKFLEHAHFHEHRKRYAGQCKTLTELLENVPPLRHWIRAVDAAASELDTPPYVFAPAFRAARDVARIPHQVFHAGEDFPHLVSGIRAVYETITHLDMRQGDRIGHATALGIDPAFWLQSLPNAISISIGGWLQDLVFAWNILSGCRDCEPIVAKLDRDIRTHASRLFQHAKLSPHSISQIMDLRPINPVVFQMVYEKARNRMPAGAKVKPKHVFEEARGLDECAFHLLPPDERELRIILGAMDNMPDDVLDMARHWHFSRGVYQRGREHITVPTDYFSERELLILQQETAKLVCRRGVVLETLPTSNVRISQYQEMRQHHALRWLGVPPHAHPGDVPLIVTLGDDDPGVFCTNIKNEFYHLFISMKRSGLNSGEALQKVMELNENSARYAFRPLNHTSPDPGFPNNAAMDSEEGDPLW